MLDQDGNVDCVGFGSAYGSGFRAAFCDVSVQSMSYSIDPAVHRLFGNRKDGMAVNAKKRDVIGAALSLFPAGERRQRVGIFSMPPILPIFSPGAVRICGTLPTTQKSRKFGIV